ncbi:hypothetical protein F8388_019835 [Cannabis sativa]|uniref:Core-2/I-branching beta-1,6-N-acetylglucosaminyltransferase family protein n=1 Tax=Cannabis sativa TaxID=3483 RepID=A0A7J6HNJ5_CANSA|nr:hypothetical protein F8388_019835 [Cannabis sativa]
MGNDQKKVIATKHSSSHFQFGHVVRLIFFIIGISIGISFSVYFKSFVFLLRTGLLNSLPQPPILPQQLSERPEQSSNQPTLPLRSPVDGDVEYNVKPKILHNMEDNELFSRATLVPRTLPKIAFMFLTKGPIPLGPLWETFFKGHEDLYNIYIHRHPSFIDSTPENSPVEWGKSSMLDAERRLLANALLDTTNDRFVLLSESCIPLFNFTKIYSYLINSKKSFTGSFDDPSKVGRGRYNPKMSPEISLSDWRKGSQWFEVNRKLAVDIVSDTKYYPIFQEHCNIPCYMDEHYISTLINIIRPEENSNRSVTWVDWSKVGPHPGRFTRNDVTAEFLNKIRFGNNCTYNGEKTNECFLFARKFVPNTLPPLLQFIPLLFNTSIPV